MENRSGLVVGAVVTHADGVGERAAALAMLDTLLGERPRTVAADKAYDTADFVAGCRQRNVTPHVASNDTRRGGSAIDGRTTRHAGDRLSQIVRKRIEEHFGWGKTIGRLRHTVFRGIRRVDHHFKLTMMASNLLNCPNTVGGAARSDAMKAKSLLACGAVRLTTLISAENHPSVSTNSLATTSAMPVDKRTSTAC